MSVGVRDSGYECEWYHERQELLLVGMVKWWSLEGGCREALPGMSMAGVWHWADQTRVLGVGWRHLGAKHSGILFAEVTWLLGQTGIWQKRSRCVGLGKINSSQLSFTLVVEENCGQLCERGNQSKSLAFNFLIHRFWEIRNHRRRWTCTWCSYLWLLKGWWTISIQSWQMLMGCKLLYSFSLRNMLSGRKVISNLSEQCLVAAVNLELALSCFLFCSSFYILVW